MPDEEVINNGKTRKGEERVQRNPCNTMIEAIIVDTECRFKALNEQFDFIYDISYLNSISKEVLLKYCNDLGTILREGENSNIQPFELYEELQLLKTNSLDYQRRETTHSVHFTK
ncbi:zinc finger MYM-type protein 1 [Trichonephila clavipes]|nr:zinc finger MYM-type protein 1 [Trichonephila clavipes]